MMLKKHHFNRISCYYRDISSTKYPELMRDFINDSLYNPAYGYFSKNVNIFNSPAYLEFSKLKDQDDYNRLLKDIYNDNETKNNNNSNNSNNNNISNNINSRFNQLWHTPSELFKPFYGKSICNFILNQSRNHNDLVIYEIGPGNGTLAENILNHLRDEHPKIYEKCEYNLVEISSILRERQRNKLEKMHAKRIKFPEISILNISKDCFKEERPCWILAMEVLDNLAHDLIKFRTEDGAVLEGIVHTNPTASYGSIPGKYWQEFREAEDQLILEYVAIGDELGWKWPSLKGNPMRRALERFSPFDYVNPWSCEYIPTDAFKLLKNLTKHFPNHSALFSDFDELPDTVAGHNGPVVQTRFRGVTVPCSSVLLERGLFDIFFPTNFSKLAQIHKHLNPRISSTSIMKHEEFMKKWSSKEDLRRTTTRSGYNPMIQDFENVSFYYSSNNIK